MAKAATMVCPVCGRTAPWNPWLACSLPCFDRDRPTAEEQQAVAEQAPEAFAYFLGLAPGTPADDGG
ncbi:hypothetical protein [Kitasatospora sp. NPDC127060]|uniref:hypothetical protein n=1 Tax=Kitasatospora sp. NPDC127060 TaxID=3347121 RepID=UPI003658359B